MRATVALGSRWITVALLTATLGVSACRDRPTTVETVSPPTTSVGSPGMAPPTIGQLAILDRDFIRLAGSNSAAQLEASRLVLERSADNDVRGFALHMVDEHTRIIATLGEHARRLGVPDLPTMMLPMHNEHLERLRTLDGRLFEHEYVAQIGVGAHVEGLAIFERASTTVVDPALREFAAQTLPRLQQQLQQADRLAQAIEVPANRMEQARARPAIEAQTTLGVTGVTGTQPEGAAAPPAPGTGSPMATPGGGATTAPAQEGRGTVPGAPSAQK